MGRTVMFAPLGNLYKVIQLYLWIKHKVLSKTYLILNRIKFGRRFIRTKQVHELYSC